MLRSCTVLTLRLIQGLSRAPNRTPRFIGPPIKVPPGVLSKAKVCQPNPWDVQAARLRRAPRGCGFTPSRPRDCSGLKTAAPTGNAAPLIRAFWETDILAGYLS